MNCEAYLQIKIPWTPTDLKSIYFKKKQVWSLHEINKQLPGQGRDSRHILFESCSPWIFELVVFSGCRPMSRRFWHLGRKWSVSMCSCFLWVVISTLAGNKILTLGQLDVFVIYVHPKMFGFYVYIYEHIYIWLLEIIKYYNAIANCDSCIHRTATRFLRPNFCNFCRVLLLASRYVLFSGVSIQAS